MESGSQNLALREAEIARREKELEKKEKYILKREREVLEAGAILKPPNWPFKCYAITYHSIVDDIPPEHQPMMRRFYFALLFGWFCLVWNWLTMIVVWGTPGASDSGGSEAMWASVYVLLGIPGSWRFWYRSVYYAVRDKKRRKWYFFFVNFAIHLAFSVVMALGVPSMGAGGLFVLIKMLANSKTACAILSFMTVLFYGVESLLSLYLIKVAHAVWKGAGGSVAMQRDLRLANVVMSSQLNTGRSNSEAV